MTECPKNILDYNECAWNLRYRASLRGLAVDVTSARPIGDLPAVRFTCQHGNDHWITPAREH